MSNTKRSAPGVRELLAQAECAAAGKDKDKALDLFSECTREYLRMQLPFKAIAVSRRARRVLGSIPKVSALIIRTYRATGFMEDAREELESAAAALRKHELAFLASLDEEAFLDLLSIMETVSYPKGRIIMRRQDPGEDLYVLLSGSCEVIRDGRSLAVMGEGDVFGEIGFFSMTVRSATVKTLKRCLLLRISSGPLREARKRHPCLRNLLEDVYSERVVKKAAEDLEGTVPVNTSPEVIATLRYKKGQEIPLPPEDSVAILKHGTVEVDYDEACIKSKRYLKPGAIISRRRARARAGTDVVIMITRIGEETEKGSEGM